MIINGRIFSIKIIEVELMMKSRRRLLSEYFLKRERGKRNRERERNRERRRESEPETRCRKKSVYSHFCLSWKHTFLQGIIISFGWKDEEREGEEEEEKNRKRRKEKENFRE